MEEEVDGPKPSHLTWREDSNGGYLVKGEEEILENVKSFIKKELDDVMTAGEFETMQIEQEVGCDFLKIKEEVDPLSTDNCSDAENPLLELVPTLKEVRMDGLLVLPFDTVKQLDTAEEPIHQLATRETKQDELEVNKAKDIYNLTETINQSMSEQKLKLEKEGMQDELKIATEKQYLYKEHDTKPMTINKTAIYNGKHFTSVEESVDVNGKVSKKLEVTFDQLISTKLIPINQDHSNSAVKSNSDIQIDCGESADPGESTAEGPVTTAFQRKIFNTSNKVNGSKKNDFLNNLNKLILKLNTNDYIAGTESTCHVMEKKTPNNSVQSQVDSDNSLDADFDENSNSKTENQRLKIDYNKQNVDSPEIHNREEIVKSSFAIEPDSNRFQKRKVIWKNNRQYYCCALCNKSYDRKSKLQIHEKSKCGSLKSFNCSVCAKGFTSNSSLVSHFNAFHNTERNLRFKCEHCNNVYKSKYGLKFHNRAKHQQRGCLPQTCEYCSKSYATKKNLQSHIKLKHLSGSQHFECAHCSNLFPNKDRLIIHMKLTHLPDQIRCALCKVCLSSQENLQRHLENMHSGKKKFVCDHCGKVFREKRTLDNHLRTHSDEKPCMCQTCGKCFRTESNLSQHSVIHSESRPYACEQCSKSFRIKNHLRQHMSVHGLENTSVKFRKPRKK